MSDTTTISPTVSAIEVATKFVKVPGAPALLSKIVALLDSPDSSADDIAALVKTDASLGEATLKLANSAFFRGRTPADNLTEAVFRIGQKELYKFTSLVLISRWETATIVRGEQGDFSRHSMCTALAAEVLADRTKLIDPEFAFTAGLVADVGKLPAAVIGFDHRSALIDYCETTRCSWLTAQQRVMGFTHTDVTAELLGLWGFKKSYVTAAKYIETPQLAPTADFNLASHLHAAKYVATSIGPGVTEDGFYMNLDSESLLASGFTERVLVDVMSETLARAHTRLQERLNTGKIG